MHIGYHYTSKRNLASILEQGLIPKRTLDIVNCTWGQIPEFAFRRYSFNFLDEKEPESWINSRYSYLWDMLRSNIIAKTSQDEFEFLPFTEFENRLKEMIIISFPILPTDDAHITNWGVCERDREEGMNLGTNKMYADSRIPIHKYKGQYELPELIVANTIEPSRIKIEME